MMEKFDSIYADSINDDIEFDVIFGSEEDGSLIESVDPTSFFNEDGEEKDDTDVDIDDEDDDKDDDDKDNDKDDDDDDKKCKCCKNESLSSIKDLDSFLEDIDSDSEEDDIDSEEVEDECGDMEEKIPPRIDTVDDLDRHIYNKCPASADYDKQVVHSGDDEPDVYPRQRYQTKNVKTIGDLDDITSRRYPVMEDDEDDNILIDKVDNDDGSPDEEATPADFHRPEDNYQDNSFETRNELKEVSTIGDLDSAAEELTNTNNIGLETEESEDPGSHDSFDDGEDIDAVLDEDFLFF